MKNRIAFKLVLAFLGLSGMLTLLSTALQIYLEYRHDVRLVETALVKRVELQSKIVEAGVTASDDGMVMGALDALKSRDGVVYAAVLIGGRTVLERGVKKTKSLCTYTPLRAGLAQQAVLEVDANLEPIREKGRNRFARLLATNGLQIFFVAVFLFLMVQYMVTRHLGALAAQLTDMDLSNTKEPVHLNRTPGGMDDELDRVVAGLNGMRERACEAFESLEKNERRLLLFFDSTEEAILGVDRDGRCTFINDACLKLLGDLSYENTIGHLLYELFIHSPTEEPMEKPERCLIFKAMDLGRSMQDEDGFIILSGGTRLPVAIRIYPVFQNGEVSGALVFMTNNGQTREMKQEMELLSEAVAQVPILIIISDRNDTILYVNPVTERMTGYAREEIIGQTFQSFRQVVQGDKQVTAEIDDYISRGRKWEGVVETLSKWGTSLKFYAMVSPVVDSTGQLVSVITVAREVSYEIGLQDELIQAQKMEAVSRLSASFAHEFGNPLFGVRAVLKDILNRERSDQNEKQLLEMAMDECDRMRDMIRKFQELYKDSSTGGKRATIKDIISLVLEDVGPLMDTNAVTSSVQIASDAMDKKGDREKLTLVIRNVVTNAVESMSPGGGEMTIAVALDGRYIVILVGDGGGGIKQEHSEMVFEPFFSTKPEVEGAGLGLSVAYGTVKSLGGSISFHSSPGKGTTFSINVPF